MLSVYYPLTSWYVHNEIHRWWRHNKYDDVITTAAWNPGFVQAKWRNNADAIRKSNPFLTVEQTTDEATQIQKWPESTAVYQTVSLNLSKRGISIHQTMWHWAWLPARAKPERSWILTQIQRYWYFKMADIDGAKTPWRSSAPGQVKHASHQTINNIPM